MIVQDMPALLRAVPVAMLVVDHQSRIQGANEPAEALLGPVPGGRPFVTVLRHPEVNAALDAVLAGQDRARLDVTLNTGDRRVSCQVMVTRLDSPRLNGAAVSIEDRSRDEETEQMRRDFVANVSHELRTPLTALMGFIETLRGPARHDPDARARFLDIMERECRRMNRLVADLLSLSRVEQDERRRPVQSIDLAGLLRSEVATLTPAAQASGVRLELSVTEDRLMVPGDADQLVQVFRNLIENAAHAAEAAPGRRPDVELRAFHDAGFTIIEVADNGTGLPPEMRARVFDPLVTTKASGVGLGLTLVRRVAQMHGGDAWVARTGPLGTAMRLSIAQTP